MTCDVSPHRSRACCVLQCARISSVVALLLLQTLHTLLRPKAPQASFQRLPVPVLSLLFEGGGGAVEAVTRRAGVLFEGDFGEWLFAVATE